MKEKLKVSLPIIIGSYILAVILCVYYRCVKEVLILNIHIVKESIVTYNTLLCFLVLLIIISLCWKFGSKIFPFIYKYRIAIGVLVFVLCVCFEITGSSIGMWTRYFNGEETGLLLGVNRNIRTDEWAVSTPMALSQYYGENPFSYFSEIMRGTKTDAFIVYGQAVKDVGMIFRPFYLGYLFLSPAKGMAFFWCGRLIALLLVNFEFGMIITNKRKDFSFIYAILVGISPVVQWWFAINGLVEMLIFMQLSIIMLWKYMESKSTLKRLIYGVVIMICAGGYILVLYPAWQIPLFYILVGLIIYVFITKFKECKMKKADWFLIGLLVVIFALLMYHIFDKSAETIKAVLGTAYPGKRISTGGKVGMEMMDYVSNIWTPMFDRGSVINQSESARFVSFFPLSYLLPLWVLIKEKKKDSFLIIFMVIATFLGFYCVVGFPEKLSVITLLSYSPGRRALVAFGFANILLLLRSLSVMKTKFNRIISMFAAGILSIGVAFIAYRINPAYYSKSTLLVTITIFAIVFYGILTSRDKYGRIILLWSAAGVVLISGSLVNPVRKGIDDVTNLTEFKEIREITMTDPKGKWMIDGLDFPMSNFTILNGAPTINCTNTYPNLELWDSLNTKGQKRKLYNRYANFKMILADDSDTWFEYIEPDYLAVYVNTEDFYKLDTKYVYSHRDIRELNFGSYEVEKIGTNIYKVY